MSTLGYINYYDVLGLAENANPGEVRKTFKRKMKNLVGEIARAEITTDLRSRYLVDMAKLNAAVFILRDKDKRELYWVQREELIALEEQWRTAASSGASETDSFRRSFDSKCRHFMSVYMEEAMLEAGRDKECVESSHWDLAHERYASNLLRNARHLAYHEILERLPYYEVTTPTIDWDERALFVQDVLSERGV